MALLQIIFRKMYKNKWLQLVLLCGLILSVALSCSIPIYSKGILQKVLQRELYNLAIETEQHPGAFLVNANISTSKYENNDILKQTDNILKEMSMNFGIPIQYFVRERTTEKYKLIPTDTKRVDPSIQRVVNLKAIDGINEHIRIIDGRYPEKNIDGVYEVLVVPEVLSKLNTVLGTVFTVQVEGNTEPILVKLVGVFEPKNLDDLFWYSELSSFNTSLIVDFEEFNEDFTIGGLLEEYSRNWYFALDYSKMGLDSIEKYIVTTQTINDYMAEHFGRFSTNATAISTISTYANKASSLRLIMWSLYVPVILILYFYLFMVSNLMVDRQKTEIAVLRSRGASRLQIICIYIIESLILGAIALGVGPYVGLLICKTLGASDGFMDFAQRIKLEVSLDSVVYKYALVSVLGSITMTLLPVLISSKSSIVGLKNKIARMDTSTIWKKYYIDIFLVSTSMYGLYYFQNRIQELADLGVDGTDLKIDPILFLVAAMFILGAGLLVLRVYPLMIGFIFSIGKKWWNVPVYSTLIQISRSVNQYQFVMVFLIMTMAVGLYCSSAARTINQNIEEKIRYHNGADIVIRTKWENQNIERLTEEQNENLQKNQFIEPPFLTFTNLRGVDHAARVFYRTDATFSKGNQKDTIELMGIDTYDFGLTAWMQDDLLSHHFFDYLNLIALDPSAVLVSRSLAESFNIKAGDYIYVGWPGMQQVQFNVYGIIDYWPSWNPRSNASRASLDRSPLKSGTPKLVVGHLSYIHNHLVLEPYEIWIKLKKDISSREFYEDINKNELPIISLIDTREDLIKAKSDPFLLAINGTMTIGFLISIFISFIGYLLYWILSLSARTLQFGVFRAMGVSFYQLLGYIIGEQLLVTISAVCIGVFIGNASSELFVPLFQLAFESKSQVPPFRVVIDLEDKLKLYFFVSAMLSLCIFILTFTVSKTKIHQALKLGEDA